MGSTNENLKVVIVELSAGNFLNNHINLRSTFGLFPADCLGEDKEDAAAETITVIVGVKEIKTDIDETKAIFRRRGPFKRFFQDEAFRKGDLVMIEPLEARLFATSSASKHGFNHYL